MRYSRMCQSSDMKDRVYGVLGLFEPGFMTIDYKLPVEEIFRRFVEASIKLKGELSILQSNGSQRHLSSLPSWVPDLSSTTPLGTLPTTYFSDTCSRCDEFTLRQADGSVTTIATTGFPKKILPGLEFRADGALVVRGKLVDTITAIGPELPSGIAYAPKRYQEGAEAEPCSFAHVFREWESLAASLIPTWGRFLPSSVTDAFATTLNADQGELGDTWGRPDRAFCEHMEGFAQWYRLCGTGVLEAADPSGYLRDVEFFMHWAGTEAKHAADSLAEGKLPSRLRWYRKDVEYTIYDRRFYVTEGGSMGLAAPGARVGDRIAFIPGAYQPFVLRKGEEGESWTMHGDCYLYGLDVFALFRDDQHLVEEFVIR
ncbi:uncharacterized protein PG986_010680 [Apiospora aurea]|uniref:Uncharacterized protein n=1 Tax=Apiospora aurea TaxID=335848 RepID=A0ABR1Q3N9_9PEZI